MRADHHDGPRSSFTSIAFGALVLAAGGFACSAGDGSSPGDGAVATVTIRPQGLTLPVGGQGSLTADVRDANDAALPGAATTWSSHNDLVASVATNGTVTGVSVGLTQVIAAAGEKADTVAVLVVDLLTLEVVPGAAAVQVGGTTQFSVIARDGSGQIIATPSVVWASSNTGVGSIGETGLATGVSPGQTGITAAAGAVISPPATLVVTAGGGFCEGVEAVPHWALSFTFSYSSSGTNADNLAHVIGHAGDVTATLVPLPGTLGNANTWTGDIAGTVSINDTERNLNSNPVSISTLRGSGPPAVGLGRSIFTLSIDLDACTYEFHLSPFVGATLTDNSGSSSGEIPIGTFTGGVQPLGAWRQLGLASLDAQFDAHFVAAAGSLAGTDWYMPGGFGQSQWTAATIMEAKGAAVVDFTILPQFR